MGTAGSTHKACFSLLPIASNPLTDGVAGDGGPPGRFPEAATLLPSVDDLEAKVHFALPVGELVSFRESESQQGGIPPFSMASKSGLEGGSPSLGAFTSTS